jgi:hypothetical protein
MFRQNNAIIREQLGYFLSYFNVNMVGNKLQDVRQDVRTGVLYSEITEVHNTVHSLVNLYIFDNSRHKIRKT